jgi:hypothetical protein
MPQFTGVHLCVGGNADSPNVVSLRRCLRFRVGFTLQYAEPSLSEVTRTIVIVTLPTVV